MNNPFEETNRYRLEQSVLSPNLFYVASTSTPERDLTNSIWNIDQRAVLYPADIPTDENSLQIQFNVYESQINKQMSAAVETFWSKNNLIIESPLTSSSAAANSVLRSRFGLNGSSGGGSGSASSSSSKKTTHAAAAAYGSAGSVSSPLVRAEINLKAMAAMTSSVSQLPVEQCRYNISHDVRAGAGTAVGASSGVGPNVSSDSGHVTRMRRMRHQHHMRRSRACQTVLSFAPDVDLSQIEALRPFMLSNQDLINESDDEDDKENDHSPKRDRDSTNINDSIRKKLFEHNSGGVDDYSTSTATNSMMQCEDTTAALSAAAAPLSPPISLMRSNFTNASIDNTSTHQHSASRHANISSSASIKKKKSSTTRSFLRRHHHQQQQKITTTTLPTATSIVTATKMSSLITKTSTTFHSTTHTKSSVLSSISEQQRHSEQDKKPETQDDYLYGVDNDEDDGHDDVFMFELKQKHTTIHRRKFGQSSNSGDYSRVVCDFGDEQNDSVFITEHRPASPDLSPF